MFDNGNILILVEMLMLLYMGEMMIIRRVECCAGNMQTKVLWQLINNNTQTFFFVFTVVSCNSISLCNTKKTCEFDYDAGDTCI